MLALRSLDRAIPPRRLPSTQRSLQEAFDRKLSELLRQIRLERRWAIAGHWQTPDGARLVALAPEGDAAGRVVVTYVDTDGVRSEKRSVGQECVSTCSYRWSPYH